MLLSLPYFCTCYTSIPTWNEVWQEPFPLVTYVVYVNVLNIKWLIYMYYWRCSSSSLEFYLSCSWWVTTLVVHHDLFLICHFVHTSKYNSKTMVTWSLLDLQHTNQKWYYRLWVRHAWVCHEVGVTMCKMFPFTLMVPPCSKIRYVKNMSTITGQLLPQICIAKSSWYTFFVHVPNIAPNYGHPEAYQADSRQIKSPKPRK